MNSRFDYRLALQEFERVRSQATWQAVLAQLGLADNELLSLSEVRRKVGRSGQHYRGRQWIPLTAIVGSQGRQADFDRQFRPRGDHLAPRWVKVRQIYEERALPPIEVYKLGKAYFVADGHHRVSVARGLGAVEIEAYVTEIDVKAPISPEDDMDSLERRAEEQGEDCSQNGSRQS